MFDKLFDFIARFGRLFRFFYVTHPYQGGVILRLGNFHRLLRPGLNWIWPFSIEEVLAIHVVPETMIVGPQSLTTLDGKIVVISTVITFEVSDPKIFLLEIEGASRVIEDSTYGVVAENIMSRTWEALGGIDLAAELTKDVRRMAKKYGVNVIRVQLGDFSTSRSIRLMQSVTNSYVHKEDG